MRSLLVAFFILGISVLNAQNLTQTIKGTILDEQSQYPLIGVTVQVLNSDPIIGATTDIDGNYKLLNVPIGRQSLQFSYLGYKSETASNVVVTSAKEVVINMALTESISELKEIVVTGKIDKRKALNEMSTVSSRTFSVEEAGRYSGNIQDPARMAQNYAGVSGASDDRNDIIIRGNSPTGVLYRMEDIEIPSPNHFATLGTTGGPLSMLNINNLSNSDFTTSAFAAEYGNALSGVFDLKLRKGNREKTEFLGQIGFNGFELGAEGPFKKGKSSYLVNYRYSTLGVFNALGIDLGTGGAVPNYQDMTFKLFFPTGKGNSLSVFGLGGFSDIEFIADDLEDNLFAENNEDSYFNSATGITGINYTHFHNDETYSKISGALSYFENAGRIDTIDVGTTNRSQFLGFTYGQTRGTLSYKFNKKFSARNQVVAGVSYNFLGANISDSISRPWGFEYTTETTNGLNLIQDFIQWKHRFSDELEINLGLHSMYLIENGSFSLEPRLGVKHNLTETQTLSFGLGLHSQTQQTPIYFRTDRFGNTENEDLDFTRALHVVLGYDWNFAPDMRLKSELYFQQVSGIPVDPDSDWFSMAVAGASFGLPNRTGLKNEGEGQNYGLEVTVEKFFSKGYYFLGTMSLFESRYSDYNEKWRNTPFNTQYVFNALGGKEFKLNKRLDFLIDAKVVFSGGQPYAKINVPKSIIDGETVYEEETLFETRRPSYFRTDFKLSIRHNGKRVSQYFGVDLLNVSNQKNIFDETFNQLTGELNTIYQRGFFPDVQYKIYF